MPDFKDPYLGGKRTLLDVRKQELREARLMLAVYEQRVQQKPKDAIAVAELYRYKSRVEGLELAIQNLTKS